MQLSYDRVFQTPSFENILLSSSTAATTLDPISLQLPVEPSEGNYYEVGLTKGFFKKVKLDANYFRRLVNNYADDNQIDNTTISFPIAFRKAIIYGAEAKLDVPEWRGFSGFLSYSYTVGNAWFPVTGGLFLGDDAVIPASAISRIRRISATPFAAAFAIRPHAACGSRAAFNLTPAFRSISRGTYDQALAEYGQQVVNRINFARGRIDPSFQVNASAGADIYKSDRLNMRFQVDGQNLTNVLDVIDFGGLFSGNAIGPSRSFALRLTTASRVNFGRCLGRNWMRGSPDGEFFLAAVHNGCTAKMKGGRRSSPAKAFGSTYRTSQMSSGLDQLRPSQMSNPPAEDLSRSIVNPVPAYMLFDFLRSC